MCFLMEEYSIYKAVLPKPKIRPEADQAQGPTTNWQENQKAKNHVQWHRWVKSEDSRLEKLYIANKQFL